MTTDTNLFPDLAKMMQQFKVPGLDMAPILESRRKDIEALVEANKATFEAMQALARKQTEILTESMQGIQASAKSLASGATAGSPAHAKQTELVRGAYEKALADMKDMAEMARKSQVDVMAGITKRATQSLEETRKLMQPT